MSILVTGGAGYIGSHICKQLSKAGYQPIALDNLSRGYAHAVKWGPLIKADIADRDLVLNTLETYQPKAVIHCAAYAYVEESMSEPSLYHENNIFKQVKFLEALKAGGINRLVFSSTCAVYASPLSVYGWTKFLIEKVIKDLGFHATILRYYNAAGADIEGEIGEEHNPETHLIPNLIDAALGKCPFTLYGDGSAIRDYVHVDDLARAHILALDHTGVFDLGTGTGHAINDVIRAVEMLTGKEIPIHYELARKGDPTRLVADPTRAEVILGWKRKDSDLGTILTSALNSRNKK